MQFLIDDILITIFSKIKKIKDLLSIRLVSKKFNNIIYYNIKIKVNLISPNYNKAINLTKAFKNVKLSLSGNKFSDYQLKKICDNVNSFFISHDERKNNDIIKLFKNLEKLSASYDDTLTDDHLFCLTKLKSLELWSCHTSVTNNGLKSLINLKYLTIVNPTPNIISLLKGPIFIGDYGINYLTSLRTLVIADFNNLTDKALIGLTNLRKLEIIRCPNIKLKRSTTKKLHKLRKLKLWDSNGIQFTDDVLYKLTKLKKLALAECNNIYLEPNITKRLIRLKKLELWDSNIEANELIYLSELTKLKIVRCPNISKQNIDKLKNVKIKIGK